jgi:hypothetical protein
VAFVHRRKTHNVLVYALALVAQQTVVAQDQDPALVQGRGGPDVEIPRIEAEVAIDGVLDEPAWASAARLGGFSQYEPIDGRPAEERTEVLVWYSPSAIHFGIVAHDRQPGRIRATQADRDNIGDDDHVLLYLDTFNDRRRAYFFGVNPLGVQQDGVRAEGSGSAGRMFGGGGLDTSPDFLYDSHGRLTPEGYVVEVRVPFKSLRYASSAEQRWGFNVVRAIQRTGYTDSWTDVRRANASFLTQSGTLTGMHDLRRGVVFEAQPFLTATANGAPRVDGGFRRADPTAEIGLNARVGFTNVTLDGTINPDFSQVESDAGQVTVNERFALFFPEKRPFFLEGIELFSTPQQLVYTRRIVAPVGGAKVTGKFGALGVAHLTMIDENVDAQGREALFNVTRLRRDFGSNSLVGATFTDRSVLDGGTFNRVAAADVRYVFGGMYYAEAQLGGSWTGGPDVDTRSDPIWQLTVDRTGRRFGFHYSINGVGDDFRSDAGFVNRTGIVSANAFNRFTYYGETGALLETATAFFGPSRIWREGELGEDAIEGNENVRMTVRLRGGWELNGEVGRDFVQLDPLDYAGLASRPDEGDPVPYVPVAEVSGPGFSLSANTPTFQRFDARVDIGRARIAIFDEGTEGDGFTASAGVGLRPTPWTRVAFSTTYQRITRARDESEFARSVIPRLQAELQPTRALMFRVITEYRAERVDVLRDERGNPLFLDGAPLAVSDGGGLQVDLLGAYEPAPGTVVFVGYGGTLAGDEGSALRTFERVRDGFFLKLAYQFRR